MTIYIFMYIKDAVAFEWSLLSDGLLNITDLLESTAKLTEENINRIES